MSKRQIYNRLGESALGALIGGGVEFERARRGGEDKEGKVVSAISGGVLGALGGAAASALVRNVRAGKQIKKALNSPKYHSMTDRLSQLQNKLDEKTMRYKNWNLQEAIDRQYAASQKPSGYPQTYSGALEQLVERQKDLSNQSAVLKNLGDPSMASPIAYVNKQVAQARQAQIKSDVDQLKALTDRARKAGRTELSTVKAERDYVNDQMKHQAMLQREYAQEASDQINKNLNAKFLGLI